MTRVVDFAVVGGGIVGLALADALLDALPGSSVVVLDKEDHLGEHASGRNSGVLHAGFYYSPDSLKAQLTRRGNEMLHAFCDEHGVAVNRCGKLVVTRTPASSLPSTPCWRGPRRTASRWSASTRRRPASSSRSRVRSDGRSGRRRRRAPRPGRARRPRGAGAVARWRDRPRSRGRVGARRVGDHPHVGVQRRSRRQRRRPAGRPRRPMVRHVRRLRRAAVQGPLLVRRLGARPAAPPRLSGARRAQPVPRRPPDGDGRRQAKIGPTAIPAFWREDYGRVRNFSASEVVETARLYPRFLRSPHHDVRALHAPGGAEVPAARTSWSRPGRSSRRSAPADFTTRGVPACAHSCSTCPRAGSRWTSSCAATRTRRTSSTPCHPRGRAASPSPSTSSKPC